MRSLLKNIKKRRGRKPADESLGNQAASDKIVTDGTPRDLPFRPSEPESPAIIVGSSSAVATHAGFDHWLSAFQPAAPVASELPSHHNISGMTDGARDVRSQSVEIVDVNPQGELHARTSVEPEG